MVRCTHQKPKTWCYHIIFISILQNMVGILLGKLRLIFQDLVNFQSFRNLSYFYIMMSNCKNGSMIALEHHHMSFQPHHTCHIIMHAMSSLPFLFLCHYWSPLTSMTTTFNNTNQPHSLILLVEMFEWNRMTCCLWVWLYLCIMLVLDLHYEEKKVPKIW